MAKEVKKVIDIDVSGAQTSVKDLRKEMKGLRDSLLNLTEGSEEYDKVVKQLQNDQDRLEKVMRAHNESVGALPGSYNALTEELRKLKKEWKGVAAGSEEFNNLQKRILSINTELKQLDAGVGDFHRNVGNYKDAFLDAFNSIVVGSDSVKSAFTKLGTSMKLSLSANPIGLIITAITTLLAAIRKNDKAWGSLKTSFQSFKPFMDVFNRVIEDLAESLGDIVRALANTLKPLLPVIRMLLVPITESIRVISNLLSSIGNTISNVFTNTRFGDAFSRQLERIEERFNFINGLITLMSDGFNRMIDGVRNGLNSIAEFFSPITSAINSMSSAFDPVIDKINNILKPLRDVYDYITKIGAREEPSRSATDRSNNLDSLTSEYINKQADALKALLNYQELRQNILKQQLEDTISEENANTALNKAEEVYKKSLSKVLEDRQSVLEKIDTELLSIALSSYDNIEDIDVLIDETRKIYKAVRKSAEIPEIEEQNVDFGSSVLTANAKLIEKRRELLDELTKIDGLNTKSIDELNRMLSQLESRFTNATEDSDRLKYAESIKVIKERIEELNKALEKEEEVIVQLETPQEKYDKWAKEHVNDIIAGEKAVEEYNKQLEIQAKLEAGTFLDGYREEVQEEEIDERDPLDYIKSVNDLKLKLAIEFSDEYYELLKERENWDYMESRMKLELAEATNEELELLEELHNQELNKIDEERLAKQKENFWLLFETYSSIKDDIVGVMDSIGNAWEGVLEAQLNTGKISERDYKQRQKTLQAFQIATIIAQSAASIFDIWAGYAKEKGVVNPQTAAATGPAAAAVLGALNTKSLISAIANTAMIGATATAQIAAVKSKSGKGSSVSAMAIPDSSGSFSGVNYTRNIQTTQEEQALYSPTRVYVLESDITDAQNRVQVRESESTF